MSEKETAKIPCMLTYGKRTKSDAVLPTTEPARMALDEEAMEIVFVDEKDFEMLRVGPEDVEVMELSSRGLFRPKSELLAVTKMDEEGSVLTFDAKEIPKAYRDAVIRLADPFTHGLYIHRAQMWIRDEEAFASYQQESEE